jgi:hypothetical protein
VAARRCAWNKANVRTDDKPRRPVWARKEVVSMACPKSMISAHSLEMLERFSYWKASGGGSLMQEEARTADALLFLNQQWIEEQNNGEIKEQL